MNAAHRVREESGVFDVVRPPQAAQVTQVTQAGESLEEVRRAAGGKLGVDEVLRIVDVLLFHMDHARKRGAGFRHLHADAIVRIDDGGLVLGAASRSHATLPEGETTCDRQTDVFVVGALTFYLLTGEEPQLGPHGPVLARTLFGRPIPSRVARAVARALHPRRAVRWLDIAELRDALFGAEGALPTLPAGLRQPEWALVLTRRVR